MFQVAAMRVLTLKLQGLDERTLKRKELKVYRLVTAMTILFWFGVLLDFVLSVICLKKEAKTSSVPSCLSASISKQTAQYINGTLFGILFVLMAIVSVPLCGILQQFSS